VRIVVDRVPAKKVKANFKGTSQQWKRALTAAANMAASMIEEEAKADITAAGNFGELADSVHVSVSGSTGNMAISMRVGDPRAALFETGGVIEGRPLLWLPLSGTDAEGTRASDYPGALFSVQPKNSDHPLLFSMADKLPKYFGIESVTIPKKFHLADIQKSVMANFREIFDAQLKK